MARAMELVLFSETVDSLWLPPAVNAATAGQGMSYDSLAAVVHTSTRLGEQMGRGRRQDHGARKVGAAKSCVDQLTLRPTLEMVMEMDTSTRKQTVLRRGLFLPGTLCSSRLVTKPSPVPTLARHECIQLLAPLVRRVMFTTRASVSRETIY